MWSFLLWNMRFAIFRHKNERKCIYYYTGKNISSRGHISMYRFTNIVETWISIQNVYLLDWQLHSPGLNIMENVLGWLSRKVYEFRKQYERKSELIHAIKKAWTEISLNYIKTLYDSIPKRIFEVISNKGGSTHYY